MRRFERYKIVENLLHMLQKIEHEWNGHLENFSLPQAVEFSFSEQILYVQKTVVGCPCFNPCNAV